MFNSESLQSNLVALQAELLRFAMRLTADRDDALDLLQDTNLKIMENSGRFVPDTNFKGWAFKIMQNIFFNNCQRARHPLAQTVSLDAHFYNIASRADCAMSPQQRCETLEIKKAVRGLRTDHRTAFTMLIYGYRYKEISNVTGWSETIVKNNIALARRSLQSTLEAYRV